MDITTYDLVPALGDSLVAIVYQQAVPGEQYRTEFISRLGLYDLERGAYVYEGIELHPPKHNGVALAPMQVDGDLLYISIAETIMCYRADTGEELWRRKLPREIWTSGFIVSDGVCAVNCENKTMYGLDALSGEELWTVPTAQLSTPLEDRVINGVVYFAGRSDKSIFAVDLRAGELVWKLDAEEMFGRNSGFETSLSARQPDGDTPGLVYVRADGQVHCIEAHR